MKTLSSYIVLALVGLMLIGAIEASAQEMMKKELVLRAAEDLKWEQTAGAPPGVMGAMLWSDNTTGAYGELTKFPAGFASPLHVHTYDYQIVVIKGVYTFNGKKYGAGSYLSVPGGVEHVSGGNEDSETIFFMQQPGKFDLQPVELPKEKK